MVRNGRDIGRQFAFEPKIFALRRRAAAIFERGIALPVERRGGPGEHRPGQRQHGRFLQPLTARRHADDCMGAIERAARGEPFRSDKDEKAGHEHGAETFPAGPGPILGCLHGAVRMCNHVNRHGLVIGSSGIFKSLTINP